MKSESEVLVLLDTPVLLALTTSATTCALPPRLSGLAGRATVNPEWCAGPRGLHWRSRSATSAELAIFATLLIKVLLAPPLGLPAPSAHAFWWCLGGAGLPVGELPSGLPTCLVHYCDGLCAHAALQQCPGPVWHRVGELPFGLPTCPWQLRLVRTPSWLCPCRS